MIRWSYLTPRLVIIGALLLFLGHGTDPLLRWSLITGGEKLLGSKVDVDAISTSLGHTQMAAQRLSIANPYAPDTNAVEAEYLWLDIEGGPLTHNRIVVREGIIHGLKINAARDESGAIEPGEVADSELGDLGKQWLENAAKALGSDFADDLESVQLAHELRDRWPEDYKQLESRIDLWLEQVKALERLPDEMQGDVLQQTEQVRRAALTLRSLKEELAALRTEFQRLHQQARLDRTDLAAAAARDKENIKQRLQLAKLEPETLTDYFLGPELGHQTRETLQWVQWIRGQIPSSDLPPPQRDRGIDILFPQRDPQPWLLVRSLQADGEFYYRGRSIPFAAVANDWSIEPTVHRKPATVKLKTTVPIESWIELTVDHSGLQARDRLTFICPQMPMQARTLGDEKYLALQLPEGTIDLRATFSLVEDQVAGTIQLQRGDADLGVAVGDKLRTVDLATRMQERFEAIDQLSAVVTVTGTVRKPQLSIASPLGGQVQVALRESLQEEFDSRREQLAAKARTEIDQEIQALQDELAIRKASAMRKLNIADEQQRMIEQLVANAVGGQKGQIGRTLLKALQRR